MHTFFYGGVLSQWCRKSPFQFEIDSIRYNCAEQYMMAEKARLFKDDFAEGKIMNRDHPKDQKAWGRKVKNFVGFEWQAISRDVVYRGNYAKFSQNKEYFAELKQSVGTILVEASPYDKIWGIGKGLNDSDRLDPSKWDGTNWLGQVMTKVRDDLINGIITEEHNWI